MTTTELTKKKSATAWRWATRGSVASASAEPVRFTWLKF